MTRDRGYPDWLVLSARLLRSGYHSAGCVWLVAMCSLLLYVVIFVTIIDFRRNRDAAEECIIHNESVLDVIVTSYTFWYYSR